MHAHLRTICENEGITCGKDENSTALFKRLREGHPAFSDVSAHSEEVLKLQRAVAVILDVFNPLRNRGSVAHPNTELLPHNEAMLAINVAKSILKYLDAKLENYRAAHSSS